MEGSSHLQGSRKADYRRHYLQQPKAQNQPFHDVSLSRAPTFHEPDQFHKSARATEKEIDGRYQRWTDEKARLLINALSYISEAALSELNSEASSRKFLLMPKAGRWKIVSKVMGERGYNVSPQQCRDMFNEINWKYKQLIGILGMPTSCDVVENPMLLESIDLPESEKQEVRNLLSSEQFLYREMCSFYNNNRLFLPHDWELRRSIMLILAGNSGQEVKDGERNGNKKPAKRRNLRGELDASSSRLLFLAEKQVELQQERVQLEKERLDWLWSNHIEDMKLQMMRQEIETIKLKNARLAFELKCRELGIDNPNN